MPPDVFFDEMPPPPRPARHPSQQKHSQRPNPSPGLGDKVDSDIGLPNAYGTCVGVD